MLKLLESHEIPFAQEGEILYPVGSWSKPAYQGKTYKVIETQPTTIVLPVNDESNATAVAQGNYVLPAGGVINTINLDASLEPQGEDVVNQIRVGIPRDSALALYVRYLSGTLRGGLQKGAVSTPQPANALLRYLGAYRHFHSPADKPRLQLWWTQGKTPAFALANWSSSPEKAVLFMTIQKMRIRQTEPAKRDPNDPTKIIPSEWDQAIARGTRIHYLYSESTMTI